MFKILTLCLSIYVVTESFDRPRTASNEDEVSRWQHRHIINMTENIIKDAMYKLRHADVVQTVYKNTYGYELGLIAAGIMEKYRHMLVIYRYYSNAVDFKNGTHTVQQILNAYASIQSDYNEMLHETVLFYEVLDYHLKLQAADRIRANRLARKYKKDPKLMLSMIKMGINYEEAMEGGKGFPFLRRTVQRKDGLNVSETDSMEDESFSKTIRNIYEVPRAGFDPPKERAVYAWVTKNENNNKEAEYKRNLRYKMWAAKWDGFNPDIEGVNVPDKIARMGLKNASDFLMKEIKGDFI